MGNKIVLSLSVLFALSGCFEYQTGAVGKRISAPITEGGDTTKPTAEDCFTKFKPVVKILGTNCYGCHGAITNGVFAVPGNWETATDDVLRSFYKDSLIVEVTALPGTLLIDSKSANPSKSAIFNKVVENSHNGFHFVAGTKEGDAISSLITAQAAAGNNCATAN